MAIVKLSDSSIAGDSDLKKVEFSVDLRGGETLHWLNRFTGSSIVMVGNSMSDYVDGCRPGGAIQCAFVGDARIEAEATVNATYISRAPNTRGVQEILSKILFESPK